MGRALVIVLLALAAFAPSADAALRAEWFAEVDLTGPVQDVTDADPLDHYWDFTSPAWVDDTFSVRWTGQIEPQFTEQHTFHVTSDDGVRLYVDDTLVVDNWTPHTVVEDTGQIDLVAGHKHDLRLEFFDSYGEATIKLEWASASQAREVVPQARLTLPPPPADPLAPEEPKPPRPETPRADRPDPGPPVVAPPRALPAFDEPLKPRRVLPDERKPVAGRTFNAGPERGTVTVRLPGSSERVALEAGAALPDGARVDATRGAVRIETAPGAGVRTATQSMLVWGAEFRLTQAPRGDRLVTFDMRSDARCPARGRARAAARGDRKRRLWARGKGRFRTRGRYAAATVRGTTWSVEDSCARTITRVRSGVVSVRDLVRRRTVTLRAGQRHVAAARRAKTRR